MKKLIMCLGILGIFKVSFAQNIYPWPSSGNIGIGTENPNNKLEIDVTSVNDNNYVSLINNAGWSHGKTNNIVWRDSYSITGGLGMRYDDSQRTVDFVVNSLYNNGRPGVSSIPFIVKGNGKIGIGTINPNDKLEINVTSPNHNNYMSLINNSGWTNGKINNIVWRDDANITGGLGMQYDGSHGTVDFVVNSLYNNGYLDAGTVPFIVKGTGNVGIGTTTPKEKLSVNGKIRAHEVKIETVNWPDYVFGDGYELEKLEGLERFIKVNKHLPEIPSAAEAEKEGISLGEMNTKLLKKIEELTLHLIEQNKRINAQQEEISQLKNKLLK